MVSEEKLIRQGIRQTDAWFKQFKKQVNKDLSLCDTYEEFLERTQDYTTSNIMINSGYSAAMENLIVQMMNDIKFQRASQRELVEQTIRNNVGNLISDVGEDIKQTVRDTVSEGYDKGLHPTEIGKELNAKIDTINSKRARTIARTEVKRTDTIANYVVAKEDGATGFVVQCRPDCCELCAEEYAGLTDFTPSDSQYGETVGGNINFSMEDIAELPPLHPNCRCSVKYIYPRQDFNVRRIE